MRPATLKFEEAGEQAITSTWRLGGRGLPDYRGWKSIRILYPNVMISNRAGFEIHCEAPAAADLDNEAVESITPSRPALSGGPALLDGWPDNAGQSMPPKQAPMARLQPLRPDLVVAITGPNRARAGNDIGASIRIRAMNRGRAPAPGTTGRIDPDQGYMIDLVISTDARVPVGFATFSASFAEDALLRGGRISNTADLAPGAAWAYRAGATIPADTPTGRYYICARVDSGNKVGESNENNNTACLPIAIKGRN